MLPQTSASGNASFQCRKSRIDRASATFHISAALSGSALACQERASALTQAQDRKIAIEQFKQQARRPGSGILETRLLRLCGN